MQLLNLKIFFIIEHYLEFYMKKIALLFILSFIPFAALADGNKENCKSYNYIFDIGSGTSKSSKYEIDKCEFRKVNFSLIDDKTIPVQYQHCIEKSGNSTLSKECIEEAKQSIQEFKKHYGIDCQNEKCYGIATAWARNAKNAKEVINEFRKEGINIKTVTQQDEGRWAYEAVLTNLRKNNPSLLKNLMVLDVGGGSYQLIYSRNGQVTVYNGPYGNSNFRSLLIKNFGAKYGIAEGDGRYFPKTAIEDILLNVTHEFKVMMKNLPQIKYRNLVGIGGTVKGLMMDTLALGDEIKKEKIKEQIFKFAEISYDEAKLQFKEEDHSYIPFMQTALILVYCIMDALEIDTLHVSDAKSAEAIVREHYSR